MFESTAGHYSTDNNMNDLPPFVDHPYSNNNNYRMEGREDLASLAGYVDDEDDMAELSDSPSSIASNSRPTTPSGDFLVGRRRSSNGATPNTGKTGQPQSPTEPFSLSHKAERILGLSPGTLPHAKACLENARDEVRRLGSASPEPIGNNTGVKEKMTERAKKTMSIIGLSQSGQGKVPGVILTVGGRDEEEKRERLRRAADGVLYWQREVGRLETEESSRVQTTKRR